MGLTNNWQALACSGDLVAGETIVAGFFAGSELALWRSLDGTVQVWENRCPHRSVRFTMGQIVGDTLSCAYHGWQFAAGGGQCTGIPAHPATVPPKGLCAKVMASAEVDGMVWVRGDWGGAAADAALPATSLPADWNFCRTLSVRKPCGLLSEHLQNEGWRSEGLALAHPALPARAFLLDARPELAMAHVWTSEAPGSAGMQALHAELRRLRSAAEARS